MTFFWSAFVVCAFFLAIACIGDWERQNRDDGPHPTKWKGDR